MHRYPLEHVDQIGIGVDAVQPAGHDQALDDPDVLGAELGPTEQPRLALMRSFA